jgi:hypothetical protein
MHHHNPLGYLNVVHAASRPVRQRHRLPVDYDSWRWATALEVIINLLIRRHVVYFVYAVG